MRQGGIRRDYHKYDDNHPDDHEYDENDHEYDDKYGAIHEYDDNHDDDHNGLVAEAEVGENERLQRSKTYG